MLIEAVGDRDWDWPCVHLEGGDTVDLSIGWTALGQPLALPDGTVGFQHLPVEGSHTSAVEHEDAAIESDRLVLTDFVADGVAGVRMGLLQVTAAGRRTTLRCLLDIQADLLAGVRPRTTLRDIRFLLFDRLGPENIIIDTESGQEFPDRLLYEGLVAALRYWNDTARQLQGCGYHAGNFPDRQMLAIGAAGWTLRSYRMLLARRGISAQGQISPEKERLQAYAQMGAELYGQYLMWVAEALRFNDQNDGWAIC